MEETYADAELWFIVSQGAIGAPVAMFGSWLIANLFPRQYAATDEYTNAMSLGFASVVVAVISALINESVASAYRMGYESPGR
jgi:hypothetical protein